MQKLCASGSFGFYGFSNSAFVPQLSKTTIRRTKGKEGKKETRKNCEYSSVLWGFSWWGGFIDVELPVNQSKR
jgi:hypothetical protein